MTFFFTQNLYFISVLAIASLFFVTIHIIPACHRCYFAFSIKIYFIILFVSKTS